MLERKLTVKVLLEKRQKDTLGATAPNLSLKTSEN